MRYRHQQSSHTYDKEYLAHVTEVRAMALTVPVEVGEDEDPLKDDENVLEYVAQQMIQAERAQKRSNRGIVVVPEGEHLIDDEVQALIAAIHRDYDGVVLKDRIEPDPPVRGPFGEGKIELKPGATAKKQRPIQEGVKYRRTVMLRRNFPRCKVPRTATARSMNFHMPCAPEVFNSAQKWATE